MINTTSKFPSRVRAAAVQLLHTFYGVWKRNNEIIAAMRDGKSRKQAIDEVYPLREELPLADGHTDLSFLPVRAAQHDSIHSRDEFDDEFDDALLAGVDLNLATTTSLPRRTLLSVDELNFITDIETKNNRFAEDMHPVMGFLSGLVQSRFKDTTGSGVDDALYLALIDAMVDAIVAYASRQRTSSDAAWQSMVNMHGPLAFWATASMQQYFRLDNRIRNLRFMNALLAFDADRTVRMFEELSMQVWFEAFVDQWLSAVGPFSAIFRETFDSYSRRLFACDVEVLRGIMFDEIAMKRGRETASLALLGGKEWLVCCEKLRRYLIGARPTQQMFLQISPDFTIVSRRRDLVRNLPLANLLSISRSWHACARGYSGWLRYTFPLKQLYPSTS